ncbi:MAG: hypothetical protein NZ656_09500 [Nitrospinaceae bacterium]|nr:hypothetical protein [Nitrospinaceae bacterium]
MTLFELGVGTGLAGLMLAGCGVVFFWQEGRGIFCLWRSMDARQKQFEHRKCENISFQESQALEVVLETCSRYQGKKLFYEEGLRFLPDTLRLISQVATIYYPDEKAPMEKARIGNVLSAFLEVNRKILDMLEIPGLERLTQFRLREVMPGFEANKKNSGPSFIPAFFKLRVRLMTVRALWVQWMLFVGESAIKVYGEHLADEIPEPETLLDEMDQLQDETDPSLPDEVREIVETSRKNVLFSLKPLPWAEVKYLYISLAENIARVWYPQSSAPLYEVRVYDLLKSGYLEWVGNLSRKPVLNKMLGLRLSYLIKAREVAVPFAESKLFDWAKKYQVGRAAKWSKTIFKTLQKKQPAILFRDVAMGIVKEGGKRWLILYLHGKIANETNKLYTDIPDSNVA